MATKKEDDNKAKAIRLKQEREAKMLRQREEAKAIRLKQQEETGDKEAHIKTAKELAKKVDLPLIKVLNDLQKLKIYVTGNEALSDTLLEQLLAIYQMRGTRRDEIRAIADLKSESVKFNQEKKEAIRLKQHNESMQTEAIRLKQQNESMQTKEGKSLSEARKLGQLLDLCCELIPAPIAKNIIDDCLTKPFIIKANKLPKTLSDIFLIAFDFMLELNGFIGMFKGQSPRVLESLVGKKDSCSIHIPESIARDYSLIVNMNYSFEDCNNDINKHKKSNRYTAALISTIYFLLNNPEIKESIRQSLSPFKNLYFIGDLLIDIGAIDSALRLYKIDESIFNTPNRLSLLANKAVQSGRLDDSINLVEKLIEQEPYHPSIPSIQAEIKRLEQRHRLKSTFSIDFSKVDELSGVEFENLLMDKFVAMGFKAESTPKTGDFGADLIVENNEGTRIIVQCKRFKSKVNLKAVQEVVGAMGHYAGDMGIVITNNSFLNSAVKLAESHDIELWDGDKLVSFLAGDLSFSEII